MSEPKKIIHPPVPSHGTRSTSRFFATIPHPDDGPNAFVKFGYLNQTGAVLDDVEAYIRDLADLNQALLRAGYAILPPDSSYVITTHNEMKRYEDLLRGSHD